MFFNRSSTVSGAGRKNTITAKLRSTFQTSKDNNIEIIKRSCLAESKVYKKLSVSSGNYYVRGKREKTCFGFYVRSSAGFGVRLASVSLRVRTFVFSDFVFYVVFLIIRNRLGVGCCQLKKFSGRPSGPISIWRQAAVIAVRPVRYHNIGRVRAGFRKTTKTNPDDLTTSSDRGAPI
jgi:hypothetical protein